jgi:hypothetical protein
MRRGVPSEFNFFPFPLSCGIAAGAVRSTPDGSAPGCQVCSARHTRRTYYASVNSIEQLNAADRCPHPFTDLLNWPGERQVADRLCHNVRRVRIIHISKFVAITHHSRLRLAIAKRR